MLNNLEKLNMELMQAQMLLRACRELNEDIPAETSHGRFSGEVNDCADIGKDICIRIAKFGHRDMEIRRMLKRLELLTRFRDIAA